LYILKTHFKNDKAAAVKIPMIPDINRISKYDIIIPPSVKMRAGNRGSESLALNFSPI